MNFSVRVFLLALVFACGSESDQDAASRAETAVAGASPTLEATTAPASTATPESRARPTATGSPAAPETPVAASPTPRPGTPDVSRTITVPSVTGRVMVSGILAVAIGDPPGDTGRARQAATLRDASGKLWRLAFDSNVFPAPASLFDWSLKRVNVEGMPTGEPDTILVTSMVLAP